VSKEIYNLTIDEEIARIEDHLADLTGRGVTAENSGVFAIYVDTLAKLKEAKADESSDQSVS
jgi:hypothetical protein